MAPVYAPGLKRLAALEDIFCVVPPVAGRFLGASMHCIVQALIRTLEMPKLKLFLCLRLHA